MRNQNQLIGWRSNVPTLLFMRNIQYFLVPIWNSAFKVTEDCCYEQVVFAGPHIGIKGKIDHVGDHLNSWDLLCYTCNVNLEVLPITQERYRTLVREVNDRRA
jgi:hypothetical protein